MLYDFLCLEIRRLACEEVCTRNSLLFLVQTSLQARHQISRHRKSYNVRIRIENRDFVSFVEISSNREEIFTIQVKNTREGSETSWRFQRVVPVSYEGDTLVSLWRRKDEVIQEILDFLMEFFRIKEISFRFKPSIDIRSAVLIVEHCISKNQKIANVEWEYWKTDKIARRCLEASKSASNMIIGISSSSTIHFDKFHLFRMDRIEIKYAKWITVEQIVALRNCKRIDLGNVLFDESSLNKILLEWIENPGELQEAQIFFPVGIKLEDAIKGLKISRVEINRSKQKYWLNGNNGIEFSITEYLSHVVIKRET
uniref:FBA_2 domain-containing protein n=1 Tax=Caenorhabditis tropicalis TaxID=1561998 RepID=A0A1I7UT61_9PELO